MSNNAAYFAVRCDGVDEAELRRVADGCGARFVSFRSSHSLDVGDSTYRGVPLHRQLAELYDEVERVLACLVDSGVVATSLVLQVVRLIGEDGRSAQPYDLDARWVRLLAEVGASVDNSDYMVWEMQTVGSREGSGSLTLSGYFDDEFRRAEGFRAAVFVVEVDGAGTGPVPALGAGVTVKDNFVATPVFVHPAEFVGDLAARLLSAARDMIERLAQAGFAVVGGYLELMLSSPNEDVSPIGFDLGPEWFVFLAECGATVRVRAHPNWGEELGGQQAGLLADLASAGVVVGSLKERWAVGTGGRAALAVVKWLVLADNQNMKSNTVLALGQPRAQQDAVMPMIDEFRRIDEVGPLI